MSNHQTYRQSYLLPYLDLGPYLGLLMGEKFTEVSYKNTIQNFIHTEVIKNGFQLSFIKGSY